MECRFDLEMQSFVATYLPSFGYRLLLVAWAFLFCAARILVWGLLVRACSLYGGEFVHVWGRDDALTSAVPRLRERVLAVDGGRRHTVALLADGSVVGFGDNSLSQTEVPDDLAGVVAIACGDDHTLALGGDGRVWAWGSVGGQPVQPLAITDGVAIASRGLRSVVLHASGELSLWLPGRWQRVSWASGVTDVRSLVMDFTTVWGIGSDGRVLDLRDDRRQRELVDLKGAIALAAGDHHVMGLMPDGRVDVVYTGRRIDRALNASLAVPDEVERVRAIAAGARHNLALLEDGSVVAWGFNDERQIRVPAGLTGVTALGAGVAHSICAMSLAEPLVLGLDARTPAELGAAIRFEPTVLAEAPQLQWRRNGLAIDGATSASLTVEDVDLDSVGIYTLEVRDERGAVATASSQVFLRFDVPKNQLSGRLLSIGDQDLSRRMSRPNLNGVVETSMGFGSALALLQDGRVYEWRARVVGDAVIEGFAPLTPIESPDGFIRGFTNAVQVASGLSHRLVLTADGRVVAWGQNHSGQLSVPENLEPVRAIAAGGHHSLALMADGSVAAWGRNDFGQIDVPVGLREVSAVSAGLDYSVALKRDGGVVVWGNSEYGVTEVPNRVVDAVAIAAGDAHVQALLENGRVVTWGWRSVMGQWIPEDIDDVVKIASGARHSVTVHADGSVRIWSFFSPPDFTIPPGFEIGSVSAGLETTSVVLVPAIPELSAYPAHVTLVTNHRLVLNPQVTGRGPMIYQWFRNGRAIQGASGPILDIPRVGPVEAGTYELYVSDADGDSNRAAIEVTIVEEDPGLGSLGELRVWGNNEFGQVDGVQDLSLVKAVAVGGSHGLALQNDGTIVGWGNDRFGRASVPGELRDVVAIAAGERHSLALTAEGRVWMWGGRSGEVVAPGDHRSVMAIAAGGLHSLFLHDDGGVSGAGYNGYGALSIPEDLPPVSHLAAGERHSLAVTVDGEVRAWGWNRYGQIDVPVDLPPAISVAGGDAFSAALLGDGTVRVWGEEGIARQTEALGLVGVVEIASGGDYLLARLANGRVEAWGGSSDLALSTPDDLRGVVSIAAGRDFGVALVASYRPILRIEAMRDGNKTVGVIRLSLVGASGERVTTLSGDHFVVEAANHLGETANWQRQVVRWSDGYAWIDSVPREAARYFRVRRR